MDGKLFLSNLKHDHSPMELKQIFDLAHFGAFVRVSITAGHEKLMSCSDEQIGEMVDKVIPMLASTAENFYEQNNTHKEE